MNVLHICANPKPAEESVSKQLSIAFISTLVEKNPDVEITNVDLYAEPPPFLSYETWRGLWMPVFQPGYEPTKAEKRSLAYAQQQGASFCKADVLVLTMPMWNFTVPAIMKAWMDQVLSPGISFRFGDDGLVIPLHGIKKAVLLVASGGVYKEGDTKDNLSNQVRSALEFVGIDNLSVAWADGQIPPLHPDFEARKQTAMDAAVEAAEEALEECGASMVTEDFVVETGDAPAAETGTDE